MFRILSSKSAIATGLATLLALSTPSASAFQGTTQTKTAEKAAPKSTKVDLNNASAAELQELPQVGPVIAKKIIDNRPYKTFKELETKAGVTERVIDAIRGRISFGDVPATKADSAKAKVEKPETKKEVAKKTDAPQEKMEPKKEVAKKAAEPAKSKAATVDINKADPAALEALPGVGPVLAKAIINGRPYKEVADLGKVKGLGGARYAKLKDLVSVTAPEVATAKTAVPKEEMKKDVAVKKEATKAKTTLPAGTKVNINTATKEELDILPGIGPVKAQSILDGRPFEKIEDIMKVSGIKEETFAKLKDFITVK